VYNLGSGQARSFKDLPRRPSGHRPRTPEIAYIDMPEVLRGKYQYFTQARMDRLRAAGYNAPMTSLEDGVEDYVAGYLNTDDPYR
ncbi:ADP-L-glycero-D-mannoheptose-6-epimerase, partial [Caulobacter sp. B11]